MPTPARRSPTPSHVRRATRAVLAGGAAGLVVALAVRLAVFPALARAIADGRVPWLVELWGRRPGLFILLVAGATAVLSLPVLVAALWAARPRPGDDAPLLG